MAGTIDSASFTPGPQAPHKYSRTGPNYARYGEQSGFLYFPQTDRYYIDPKAVKKQYEDQGLVDKPPGLAATLLPVGAGAAALFGGKALGQALPGYLDGSKSVGGLLGLGGGGGGSAATGAANAVTAATPAAVGANAASVIPAGAAIPEGFAAVGTAADGGVMIAPAGAAAEGGMLSLGGIGSAGNAILPAAGAFGAYDLLSNDYGAGRGALQGAASGAAIGSFFGPPGAAVGAGVGGLIGLGKSFFNHETTRDVAKKHTSDLLSKHKDDPNYQSYVSNIRQQYNAPPPDPSHPFHGGQYSTFEEYKQAGLDPADLTGVYGNLKTFGNQWTNLDAEKQKAVTQGLINAGLYTSKKGEVEITDQAKAKAIFDSVTGKAPAAQPTPANPVPRLSAKDVELWHQKNDKKVKSGLLGL